MRKIFVVENQKATGWTEGTRSVVGLSLEGMELRLVVLKGINPTVEAVMTLITRDGVIPEETWKAACDYKRTAPYKVLKREGMSGCIEIFLSYLEEADGFFCERRSPVLYVSCFGKVGRVKVFLPDLLAATSELLRSFPEADLTDENGLVFREVEPIALDGYIVPEAV